MTGRIFFSLLLALSSNPMNAENVNPQVTTNAVPSANFDTIAQNHPELTIFVTLVNKAKLKDVFNGTGPFTVFAPTDEAFKKLGQKKLDELSKPENQDELSSLLIYHVIPGKYMAKNLKTRKAPSINGKSVQIEVENGQVKVNNAKVIKADLVGANGVIHEIDTVLIP